MSYADATAFRMALETRLNARARESDYARSVDRLRKIVAFERLLARLSAAAPDGWVIKGGLALEFRYGFRARTTRDLDIGTLEQHQRLRDVLTEATLLNLDDFFEFQVQSMRVMEIEETNGIQRFSIRVLLAGRRFESLTIDAGSNLDTPNRVQMISTTNLLEFAGFAPVIVPAIPLEIHVAEKLHAYTRQYVDGRQNTRVKDLIDLGLIASLSSLEMGALRAALDSTFGNRQVQTLPATFPRPGEHWRSPYAQLAREVDLPNDLDDGYRAAAMLLNPALAGVLPASAVWDPVVFAWG